MNESTIYEDIMKGRSDSPIKAFQKGGMMQRRQYEMEESCIKKALWKGGMKHEEGFMKGGLMHCEMEW